MTKSRFGSNARRAASNVSDSSMFALMDQYPDEASAEQYFIDKRWPDGVRCTKCNSAEVYDSKTKRRLTHWKCKDCGHKFTVTSGTVMDGTKLPLRKWIVAYHRIGSSKKGVSSRQLSRELGIGLRPAWHLSHRIRASMTKDDQVMSGIVETDETYIGGKRKHVGQGYRKNKIAVQTIVQRKGTGGQVVTKGGKKRHRYTDKPGQAQTIALAPEGGNVDGRTVGAKLRKHTDPEHTVLMTDESPIYDRVGEGFKEHHTVNHKKEDYSHKAEDGHHVTTNSAEGLFANLKRQITGTHHSTSKKHLPRYLEEYDHKYNNRNKSDTEITEAAIKNMEAGPVRLFKSKSGADSLIDYAHDEKPKSINLRGKRSGARTAALAPKVEQVNPVDAKVEAARAVLAKHGEPEEKAAVAAAGGKPKRKHGRKGAGK